MRLQVALRLASPSPNGNAGACMDSKNADAQISNGNGTVAGREH